jgi:regulatory protein
VIKPSPYNQALNLLARREHSRQELATKLSQREHEAEAIEQALDRLIENGLQSDARFAENYLRYRSSKGMGPQRIAMELKERGVNDETIRHAMQESTTDWFELAQQVRCRRFGEEVPADFKDKAKQQRFMQYRGFTHDQITYSFEVIK